MASIKITQALANIESMLSDLQQDYSEEMTPELETAVQLVHRQLMNARLRHEAHLANKASAEAREAPPTIRLTSKERWALSEISKRDKGMPKSFMLGSYDRLINYNLIAELDGVFFITPDGQAHLEGMRKNHGIRPVLSIAM